MSIPLRLVASAALTLVMVSCGGGAETSQVSKSGGNSGLGLGGTTAANVTGSGGIVLTLGGTGGMGSSVGGAAGPSSQVVTSLPAGFHQTDIGGYQLGVAIGLGGSTAGVGGASGGGSEGTAQGNCGNILLGVVRDFKGANEPSGHPDFEANISGGDVTQNLVSAMLGSDRKPIYASKCEIGAASPAPTCPFGPQTTSQARFDQWYRDTPGINKPYTVSLYLAPQPGGLFTFQSLHYFPVDGAGFMGSSLADDKMMHNFSFTTEIHTQFLYTGGETFQFQGDDDVWVFINNKLAVDLGGLHPRQQRSVQLDASAAGLAIVKGTIYPLDLFHAERHTTASTFRIDTNLSFVDCGTVISDKVK